MDSLSPLVNIRPNFLKYSFSSKFLLFPLAPPFFPPPPVSEHKGFLKYSNAVITSYLCIYTFCQLLLAHPVFLLPFFSYSLLLPSRFPCLPFACYTLTLLPPSWLRLCSRGSPVMPSANLMVSSVTFFTLPAPCSSSLFLFHSFLFLH